jgi:hypothetical protein
VIDILITVLKFAGMLLSGVFGVYGLLVKFRDKDDKITKAGRNALIFALYPLYPPPGSPLRIGKNRF